MELAAEQTRKTFQLVVAATKNLGIGKGNALPWKLPGEMANFRELTSRTYDPSNQNAVIMGRRTWESLPEKFRPLPGRVNVVLTRSADGDENSAISSNVQVLQSKPTFKGAKTASSLESALCLLGSDDLSARVESVFVIGGEQVYRQAIEDPGCAAIHLTSVDADIDCDAFFPAIDENKWKLWSASPPKSEKGIRYEFLVYTRAGAAPIQLSPAVASKHEEFQYLELIDEIIKEGVLRDDRTGTGTYSKFGCTMRFNLRHYFPLLTTKRVFWRGVAEELLWFISGDTSAKTLQDKDIHIWDGNGSRQYLDSIGLNHREEGDLGPVYGFQWRHFGAKYVDMHTDYTGQGVDQLADLIHRIKTNPNDRRLVLSAWNPAALGEMALPPCHMFCQFYVANGELSCQMYQRSCDLGLGVPFNIASYSLLTCMIAQVCGLRPGEFVHVLGDAHVYSNHVGPLREQLKNKPRHFPVLKINPEVKDIDSFKMSDFELVGYDPHKKIAMQMAV